MAGITVALYYVPARVLSKKLYLLFLVIFVTLLPVGLGIFDAWSGSRHGDLVVCY
jgi:hypothetical protein